MARQIQPFNDKDQEVLEYLIEYKKAHDAAPSRREIVANCWVSSTSEANRILGRLQEFGLIKINRRKPRLTRVIGGKWTYEGNGQLSSTNSSKSVS